MSHKRGEIQDKLIKIARKLNNNSLSDLRDFLVQINFIIRDQDFYKAHTYYRIPKKW
ncbi:hypothetical protein [Sphingobacterium cellulitidis]|uniref:hypothetical protein n=1 Tax=Sphingobacterium cellulitidis TaxID=1768011 RepID=UPI0015F956FA|nr:hypothetical protein [Sphingobacterium soli]MBA8986455.1 hypothetical protein [Sphingobacterium soli]